MPHFVTHRLEVSPSRISYTQQVLSTHDLSRQQTQAQKLYHIKQCPKILKTYYHKGEVPRLYFWRDSIGHEVDLLIDRGQTLTPVEIKSGQTINEDFFKGLAYWRALPSQTDPPAALVYGGDQPYMRRKVEAMSWRLWG